MELRIADADGYSPQTIVSSKDPIMSPAWSPDGRKLAYVSFENAQPSIWVQEVFTGKREKMTSFKGINGAPAWSPDGRFLALTLSKDGNPDIFIMDVARRSLRPLTRHWAIDTEPAWAPDGKSLVFTSDRGGSPQIYKVSVNGGEATRVYVRGQVQCACLVLTGRPDTDHGHPGRWSVPHCDPGSRNARLSRYEHWST